MNNNIQAILNVGNTMLYMGITGGGTGAITSLLENGGASSIFVGASIPYSQEQLLELIGGYHQEVPAVSYMIASRLSKSCGYRTQQVAKENSSRLVGVGCSASLVKNGVEREGREHKAVICISEFDTEKEEFVMKYRLDVKLAAKRTRIEEERLLSDIIIQAIFYYLLQNEEPSNPKTAKQLGLTTKDTIEKITFDNKVSSND